MIFRYLGVALLWLARLIIPGRPPKTKIDRKAPCPACGHTRGTIRTVRQGPKLFVQHWCRTCKCRWYEEVISAAVMTKAAGEP